MTVIPDARRVVDPTTGSLMEVVFEWTAVGGATSYTLQVGTDTGLSDTFNAVVGNVLTYTLLMAVGTYYSRVVDNFTSTASAEQGPFYV